MSYLCKVKLAGITHLSDARFAAAAGFDYLCFSFDPAAPDYIPPVKAKEIIDWITGSHVIGRFGNQSFDEINDLADLLQIDLIEVDNQWLPDELGQLNRPVIKRINVREQPLEQTQTDIDAYRNAVCAFTAVFDHESLPNLPKLQFGTDYFIAGINDLNELLEMATKLSPTGIEINGGIEEAPGIKDFDYLNQFCETFATFD